MLKRIIIILFFGTCISIGYAQSIKAPNNADTISINGYLTIIDHYLNNAEGNPASLDSALLYAQRAEKQSRQLNYRQGLAKSQLAIADIYNRKNNHPQSIAWANKAISLFKNDDRSNIVACGYTLLGDNIADSEKMSEEKIAYYHKAIAIYEHTGNKRGQAKVLIKLGNTYLMGGKYQTMIDLLNNAHLLYDTMQYPEKEMDQELLYERFEYAYLGKDNYIEALKYALMSVRIIEKNHDNSLKAFRIYNNVALLNSLLKRYDTQALFLKKALPIAQKYQAQNNDSIMVAQVLGNMVVSKIAQHKPAEAIAYLNKIGDRYPHNNRGWRNFMHENYLQAYTDNRQFDKAKEYYNLVVKQLGDFDKFHAHQTSNYTSLIKYLIATRQLDEAYKYLRLNDTACRKNSQIELLKTNYLNWFKVDYLKGNLTSGIQHYQQYKVISDSLINIKKASQLADLQVSYETEKKNESIKLGSQKIALLKKQAQLQATNLSHEKTIRNITFAGIIMLGLLLGISYKGYRQKQKTNKLLEEHQEELNTANESLHVLNDSLHSLLSEKEWLLKEIHHRVKNNLQIVISLLNTQSAYLDNEDALSAIQNSQHRMHAMSLIHQKLYQSDNLAFIDMSVYIRELVDYLAESFASAKMIAFNLNLTVLKLDVSQAVPLGLILNEAINNAIKYAFDGSNGGRIDIALELTDDGQYLLCIADNGKGLPDDFDLDNTTSLGMSLMQGLSQQLEGDLNLKNEAGVSVCITFKKKNFDNLNTMSA